MSFILKARNLGLLEATWRTGCRSAERPCQFAVGYGQPGSNISALESYLASVRDIKHLGR